MIMHLIGEKVIIIIIPSDSGIPTFPTPILHLFIAYCIPLINKTVNTSSAETVFT